MRYRRLSPDGDANFGESQADFLRDSPEAVAQAVLTRMRLDIGDFFLDTSEGIDWHNKVLGTGTAGLYDIAVRSRILGTQGVLDLSAYSSQRNGGTRSLGIQATVETIYGPATITPAQFVRAPIVGPDLTLKALVGADNALLQGLDGQQLMGIAVA